MKFCELQNTIGEEVIFWATTLLAGKASPADVRRQLARWVAAGKVLMLRRGVYLLAAPYAKRTIHPFVMANELRRASYVSLQSALAHYGMIPEHVPNTTSVTTDRPEQRETPAGRFLFRHIKRAMFFGIEQVEVSPGQWARMASREKALLDLLYLSPNSDHPAYLEELRLERPPEFNVASLAALTERCDSDKVRRAVDRLTTRWTQASQSEVAL